MQKKLTIWPPVDQTAHILAQNCPKFNQPLYIDA